MKFEISSSYDARVLRWNAIQREDEPFSLEDRRGTVHVWRTNLDVADEILPELESMLNETELARARRFHFAKDRRHFTAARAILRIMLSRYLGGVEAREVGLDYTPRGKPFLAGAAAAGAELKFNVSHSGGWALFAFACGKEIGVDLEAGERLCDDWISLTKRVFSERERAELFALPPEQQRGAFLDGWTRKEAFLKATGMGISDGLQRIEVTLNPANEPRFLATADDARKWTLRDLRAHAGMAAALAIEDSEAADVRLFQCAVD